MSRPAYQLLRPRLLRYDRPDWVPALLAGLSGPGPGAPELWRYYVPPLGDTPDPHQKMYRVGHPTVFQPIDPENLRWYAVHTELCLPGPAHLPVNDVRDVRVSLVIRRERYDVTSTPKLDTLAWTIITEANPGAPPDPAVSADDLRDLLRAEHFIPAKHRARYAGLMAAAGASRVFEMNVDPGGWRPVAAGPAEHEYPMWRRPEPGRTQWFGVVPSDVFLAGAADPAEPDLAWSYRARCVARWDPPPDKPFCAPATWISPRSMPFRIGSLRMKPKG